METCGAATATEIVSNIATAVAAIAALIALGVAWFQVKAGREAQRETVAKEIYRDYLRLALEYPHYAYPDYVHLSANPGSDDFQRYEWFVAFLCYASEEIMEMFGNKPGWESAIISQLGYHYDYLHSDNFVRDHYSDKLVKLIGRLHRSA